MKATGIVRRIDGLGRVVIPKEIRRTMQNPAKMLVSCWQISGKLCPFSILHLSSEIAVPI